MAKPKATSGPVGDGANTGNGNEAETTCRIRSDDPQRQEQLLTDAFVRAFDKQRSTLAGFSRCSNLEELRVVRDGFYLGMAKDLCPDEYKRMLVVLLGRRFGSAGGGVNGNGGGCDTGIVEGGNQGMLSMSFEEMVLAARACDDDDGNGDADADENNSRDASSENKTKESNPGEEEEEEKDAASSEEAADAPAKTNTEPRRRYWKELLEALFRIAETVGSDLESIWKTLEDGRMDWLSAVSAAHPVKVVLQKALANDEDNANASDAMMVWIYAICVHLTAAAAAPASSTTTTTIDESPGAHDSAKRALKRAVDDWVVAVNMTDRNQPLEGYRAELWDPRRDEWRPLDVGAQEAAERGGANLLDAWNA